MHFDMFVRIFTSPVELDEVDFLSGKMNMWLLPRGKTQVLIGEQIVLSPW